MAYEEMKATKKSSKSGNAKNALNSVLDSISKSKTTNSKATKKSTTSASKSGSSTKSTGTKKSTSSTPRKKSTKTTSPSIVDIAVPIVSIATTKSKNSNSKKSNANSSPKKNSNSSLALLLVILFLGIGIIAGYFTMKLVFAGDVYEMNAYANGSTDITIGQNETFQEYQELGVKCVAFGKDFSNSCTVKYYYRNNLCDDKIEVSNVGERGEGIYYAVYTSASIKYKTVQLIRNIIVLRGEDDA